MYLSHGTAGGSLQPPSVMSEPDWLSTNAGGTQGWSSAIGIVTAICGNILISFALNTQRYAHLRRSRDRDRRIENAKKARKALEQATNTNGAQHEEIAERRSRLNAQSVPEDDLEEAHETDALLPKVDDHKGSTASSSDSDGFDEKEDEYEKEQSYLKSPIWWVGIAMMIVGEAGNFLAYGFAPASIVSPLGVVALISNCLIAPLLLHEKFRLRDGLGVIIAVAGCVTVVLSASGSNPRLTQDKIWHYITQWEFETYFGITLFLVIVLSVASNRIGEKSILIDIGLVGLYGGYTALSTKGVASLLSNTIWRVVTFPITYLLVAVLVFTAVMQIKYINRALQRFNSTQVIPTQFVLFTLSVIVGSAILYRDFERTTSEQAVKFGGGCALTFLGVWCITSGRKDEASQDDEESQQGEDGIKLVDDEGVTSETRDGRDGKRPSIASASKPVGSRAHTMNSVPQLSISPESPVQRMQQSPVREQAEGLLAADRANGVSSAVIAAIHDDAANLPTDHTTKAPPKMHATTSEPAIPTIHLAPRPVASRAPSSPSHMARPSSSTERPTTPKRDHHLDPNDTPSRRLVSRDSIAALFPGPLTSPLSGSLSAIVADSLRRGIDNPLRRARRDQHPHHDGEVGLDGILDGPAAAAAASQKRHSIASGDFSDEVIADLRARNTGPTNRGRSLSATLGELFGVRWQSSPAKDDADRDGAIDEDTGDRPGSLR